MTGTPATTIGNSPTSAFWFTLGRVIGLVCLLFVTLAILAPYPVQAAIVSPPLLAQAASVDDLRQQQQQIDQQRSQVAKERERLKNLEKAAKGHLTGLQQTIKATSSQIQENQKKLQEVTQQLKTLQTNLVTSERAYQQKQTATVARLRFLQRQQGSRGWAILLQSHNLNEFLDRRHQLKRVYQADRQALADLKNQADNLERQRNQIEEKKNEVALLTQQLLAQKTEFEDQAAYQLNVIDRLRSDHRALEAAEAQLAKDSQNVTLLIQRRLGTQGGTLAYRGTGQMIYPTNGEITSGFGWRMHPILGYERFHTGIDFGVDYGTTIYAADSGTVIFAGWYGGYGNAVIIDHGNGITTLYGHTSELFVSEGQAVKRGDAIAAVGSTGLSTGPHLHFEVRRNGEPVDPMAYL
ncbi:MAG: peptidoglycan DD-metalloendopeptidase family protein [Scytolyngbya sp. HA4215-MV1]|jgi:murein DD-endopeptidase MepM/ murein hydrolase activator NlpD|nr:peptidoglycan DD-metalloendopeptidase family protein [Scytolyngbya sp. HA4215-MV1]